MPAFPRAEMEEMMRRWLKANEDAEAKRPDPGAVFAKDEGLRPPEAIPRVRDDPGEDFPKDRMGLRCGQARPGLSARGGDRPCHCRCRCRRQPTPRQP